VNPERGLGDTTSSGSTSNIPKLGDFRSILVEIGMGTPERTVAAVLVAAILGCLVLMLWPTPQASFARPIGPLPLSATPSTPVANESGDFSTDADQPEAWSVDPAVEVAGSGRLTLDDALAAVLELSTNEADTHRLSVLTNVRYAPSGFAADRDGDGTLSEADFDDFNDDWAFGDPNADFNADGAIDALDLVAFVDAYESRETRAKSTLGEGPRLIEGFSRTRFEIRLGSQAELTERPVIILNGTTGEQ
jgi:hypothetical protein